MGIGNKVALLAGVAAALVLSSAAGATADPSPATGVIIAVPGDELRDGEAVWLSDGIDAPLMVEFDTNGLVEPGAARVAVGATDNGSAIATKIASAVNSSPIGITASHNGEAVWLTADSAGSLGNTPLSESVANIDFTVRGMAGGTDTPPATTGPTPASGLIFTIRGSDIADGDSVLLDDAVAAPVVFEFDSNHAAAGVPIPFSASDSATTIAARLAGAIESSGLAVSTTRTGPAIWLVTDATGPLANQPILANVASPDFVVRGFAGGTDAADTTAPTDAPVASGATGSNGWYTSAVSVEWNWTDAGAGVDAANCVQTSASTGDGAAVTLTSACDDLAGNHASDALTFAIDTAPPSVAVTGVTEGAVYPFDAVPAAACTTTDAVSGVGTPAVASVTRAGESFTATCAGAIDMAGNAAAQVAVHYSVVGLGFSGFSPPVANAPAPNAARAGQAIPVKFSLGGYHGLGILATGAPVSRRVSCATWAPLGAAAATSAAGATTLSYDAATGEYGYTWKTDKAWSGTCRQLVVELVDGSIHTAFFTFR